MQPTITRETVLIDRRQSSLRWSAVFAGTACSIGFWIALQLLGLGIGLAATDAGDVRSLHGIGVGTTAWSLVSPLIAMFFGGLIAGRLAQTYDRKLAGTHGLVMWAITSTLGLCATIWIVAMLAGSASRHTMSWTGDRGEPGQMLNELDIDAGSLLAPINQRLSAQGKPTITAAQLDAAMRGMVRTGIARGDFVQELLVDQLVANTRLSLADATEVERQIEARVDPAETRAYGIERRAERYALGTIDATGKALTTVGGSLLLGLLTAVLGAMAALRRSRRAGEAGPHRSTRTTEPGFSPPLDPVTTPYTSPMAGPASPVIPPTDITSP